MTLLPFEYAVRNLGCSRSRLAAAVSGSALVVTLVLAAGSFVRGMERCLSMNIERSNVILLAAGSEESTERSQIGAGTAAQAAAGIFGIKSRLGIEYVSSEIHACLMVRTDRSSKEELRVVFRGFMPPALLVHPAVEIVEGRMPLAGSGEIMVGGLVADKINLHESRLQIGKTIWFDNRDWKIVGRFRAKGTVMDAEVWMPLTDLQTATKRSTISCVVMTLGDGEFADVDEFAKQRIDLELSGLRESEYYASLMKFYQPIQMMIWMTGMLIALAGFMGGLNTMYAAFAARIREFGTLRSLGYSQSAILVSLIQESLLASSAGTLLGVLIGLTMLDGYSVRFSIGVFQLTVDQHVLLLGLTAGFAVGIIGALPPAWRCLRMPITEALKAS